ncbi:MAG: universal stress protein [Trueperaceae bacterium]|jgi:nucleotide-binding universal stress UspA family protein|nr:universal stress protein [Truepera sp.]HRN17880.1 universal stress protein [Trueperaceae bacterium]HRQ09921.1 universal stress protein [Trueperaceae bacterium]
MYRTILVPVDRSQRARSAVDAAVHIAAASQGRVTLLHVVEIIKDTTYDEFRDFYDSLADLALAEMEELRAPHHDAAVSVDVEVVFGSRVKEVLRIAEERGFDLIVLQSHRIDPGEPAKGWGTISHRVGLLAACHVLLVK